MSIANLQDVPRFDWEIEDNNYYCIAAKEGKWCKFEDVKEGSLNSVQQLKAEIAALVTDLECHLFSQFTEQMYRELRKRMRQLSAV